MKFHAISYCFGMGLTSSVEGAMQILRTRRFVTVISCNSLPKAYACTMDLFLTELERFGWTAVDYPGIEVLLDKGPLDIPNLPQLGLPTDEPRYFAWGTLDGEKAILTSLDDVEQKLRGRKLVLIRETGSEEECRRLFDAEGFCKVTLPITAEDMWPYLEYPSEPAETMG